MEIGQHHFKFHLFKWLNCLMFSLWDIQRLWEKQSLKMSQEVTTIEKVNAQYHWLKLGERKGSECFIPMLSCRGKLSYIWLSQNHTQDQFYKITSDFTTLSSCGKAEGAGRQRPRCDSLDFHWMPTVYYQPDKECLATPRSTHHSSLPSLIILCENPLKLPSIEN